MSFLFSPRHRWLWLCLLFLTALAVRIGRVYASPMVTPGAIRYIDQARMFPVNPLQALREEVYHPLHSVAILATHQLLSLLGLGGGGAADRMLWVHAAQAVGILCSSLMSLLMFLVARQVGARFWYALAAAFMWSLGPRTSTYGAEGMSDTLALCLFTGSLLIAIHAMRFRRRLNARQLGLFACSGFLGGLAYLTRPEGLLAPLIVTLTLLIWWLARLVTKPASTRFRPFKLLPRRPLPIATLFAALAAVWLAVAVPAAPYAVSIGALTHKKTLLPPLAATTTAPADNPAPVHLHKSSILWVWNEVSKTLGIVPTAILLAVLWHPRCWGRPRVRLLVILGGIAWCFIMFWLLLSYGYLDGRHTLPLQVFAFALLGTALQRWRKPARWWADYQSRPHVHSAQWSHGPSLFTAVVFTVMLIAALIGLKNIPHPENIVFARAANWVQTRLAPEVLICDQQQLVGYYSLHPYARWSGTPLAPDRDAIRNLQATPAPVILGMYFINSSTAVLQIGDYRAIAAFPSDTEAGNHQVYILYALPGQAVLADSTNSRVPEPLSSLPP